jgi:hypothetical protein
MMKKIILLLFAFSSTLNFVNAQWQSSGTLAGFVNSIATMDSNIFAEGGGVFLSTNNGDTWAATNLPIVGAQAIVCIDTTVYVGNGHGVCKSIDYGTTWTQLNNGLIDTNVTSLAVKGTNIFAGTYSGGVFLSGNNGASWTAVNNGITNTYIRSLAASDSNIYAGTTWWNGRAFRSNNNGANWSVINNGLGDTDIVALAVHGNDIFAGTSGLGIYHSTDNGTNWTAANNGLNDLLVTSFVFVNSNIIAGLQPQGGHNYGGVYLSKDNGASWILWNEGMAPGYFNIICLAINNDYVFAGTGGSGVWKRKLSDLTGMAEIGDNSKISIFPNPARDWIILKPLKSFTETAELQLYNILGKKVLSQTLNPMQGQYNLNVSGLAEGMYIMKVTSAKGIVYNGKLVIQK